MRRFSQLFAEIDDTTRTNEKVDAMVRYFADAAPADAAWAVYYLTGNRPKRLVNARTLARWAMEQADVPEWLFDESYEAVGDLAETITLLLPDADGSEDMPLHVWVEERLLPIPRWSEARQRETIVRGWQSLRADERFVWNKLITGGWRVGVSRQLVVRALSKVSGIDEGTIAHRLTGNWTPTAAAFTALLAQDTRDADRSRPYPFYLAYALESELEALGDPSEWQAEWKWDGIRAQLVRRDGATHIWSRGEELMTERFPELVAAAGFLPDGLALDGEILPWRGGQPLPFAQLQRRIGRLKIGPKMLADIPVVLVAYDLLEHEGEDIRALPLAERRTLLQRILGTSQAEQRLLASPILAATSWTEIRDAHATAREHHAEGLMLKRRDGNYGVGRRKGGWWKWKVQPFSIDAVMVYAQAGHGRRASLNTDYTFAVWQDGALVPFAKAYSGLTDEEIRTLDAWIRRNTLEKFGPVRRVDPTHVFEIAFEGIQVSSRHKAGIAVRFPRILRWRADKRAEDADSLATLKKLAERP
jgi:DNA ligase-1